MNLELQEASVDIWDKKYRLRDSDGNPVDADLTASRRRVAVALAEAEKSELRAQYEQLFYEALEYAIPAGRIYSNAGALNHKRAVSQINCTVSDTIQDSMDSILMKLYESGLTLRAGCGIGYEFSTLRPKGSYVFGAGAATSGPLSFMDIYDRMCFTIASAGGRRGAQMGTFDVSHPDVLEFIQAKREDGRLRQFNLSVLITDEFMQAVKDDSEWVFKWNGKPHGTPMPARQLWDTIMKSTYNFAEPGFILVDRINKYNNLWFCENLRATNPCGEQPLPPYGSCLLGSVNLTKFVRNPFTSEASFDYVKFEGIVKTFTRMLDNVVENNGLPLIQQRHEIEHKRRHGMGFLGLGSTLTMLGMTYGSNASINFTSEVSKRLAMASFEAGVDLSIEKGEAPILQQEFSSVDIQNSPNGRFNSNMRYNYETYTGRQLLLQSHYFDEWREDSRGMEILKRIEQHGCRFTHATSLAPTGTISLSLGDNASNGIEPSFSHSYLRNVIREGRNAKEAVTVYSHEFRMYKHLVENEGLPHRVTAEQEAEMLSQGLDPKVPHPQFMPSCFSTTDNISPEHHVKIQAAAQKWIDSSISKTINVPTDFPFEKFSDIYMMAYEAGLKGCTTFRFNPEAFSGVLVKEDDLKNTNYTFVLQSGEEKTYSGNTLIEYEGQTQTAANLFDSIKENYFGKF